MPERLNEPALVDGEVGPERPRDEGIPALGIRQTLEVGEITFALDAVLAQAGIRLPQFHTRLSPAENRRWVVRLGDCNVMQARDLLDLLKDGLTLRERHPEEAINGTPAKDS
ncbi:hypothetical protein QWJ26_07530 [Streptomyces sp. CSDS2]|uniref:hypothetical protein n=1 Tax=Streptomyces sp. CSDS2 TaxID=3055051 RepID=UPI0025AFAE8A|nr:hypothetical protein [Streptomyces sp. CSDS2]MDN3259668.1 hypothetical protein [Streptomyces sp. CSDS2]